MDQPKYSYWTGGQLISTNPNIFYNFPVWSGEKWYYDNNANIHYSDEYLNKIKDNLDRIKNKNIKWRQNQLQKLFVSFSPFCEDLDYFFRKYMEDRPEKYKT